MPKNKKPHVSVVIPTYNRAGKIVLTVDNIEKNTYPQKDMEIVIVDDFSKDDTKKIVDELKETYGNIFYIRNKKNMGPAGSRNVGIEKARGEIIFFTDDDCLVPENWITRFLEIYEKNKTLAGVGGYVIPKGNNIFTFIEEIVNKLILKHGVRKFVIGGKTCPGGFTGNMSYKKAVLLKVGKFNPNKRTGEELDLKERVCKNNQIAFLPIPVIHNHNYNLKYFLKQVYEKGLERTPPEKSFYMLLGIMTNFPHIFLNIIKKTNNRYHNESKNG